MNPTTAKMREIRRVSDADLPIYSRASRLASYLTILLVILTCLLPVTITLLFAYKSLGVEILVAANVILIYLSAITMAHYSTRLAAIKKRSRIHE